VTKFAVPSQGARGGDRPMSVVGFIATRVSDPDRGPQVRMRDDDARQRLLVEGELVRVITPRREELALLLIDDALPRGGVVLRDVAGVAPSEIVRVTRVDLDRKRGGRLL
jgi:anaerobic selenocysteine-containing dehydrogenase